MSYQKNNPFALPTNKWINKCYVNRYVKEKQKVRVKDIDYLTKKKLKLEIKLFEQPKLFEQLCREQLVDWVEFRQPKRPEILRFLRNHSLRMERERN